MTERILAIDPGTTQSGWCVMHGKTILAKGVDENKAVLDIIWSYGNDGADRLAIEMIASYGMAVGKEVFETCVWIGRFKQVWIKPDDVDLIYRKEVKIFLCGTTKAKDPNIRQAILDLYPATGGGAVPQVGTKGQPGPLFGVNSHIWPAVGVALTAMDAQKKKEVA